MKQFYETGLLEAGTYDEEKGELTLTVIQPGFNTSKTRYYPEEMLKRDHRVFEGAKMFLDHQTAAEERARPEGSVRSWVAQIKKIWAETDGKIRATCAVIDESFRTKLKNLNAHGLLGEMGVSIRASGEARESEIQGVKTNIIERLIKSRSVDFVTFPGAGGRVEAMESDQTEEEEAEMEEKWKELTAKLAESTAEVERLKKVEEKSQELTEKTVESAAQKEREKKLEEQLKEMSVKLAESVTENEQLKRNEQLTKAEEKAKELSAKLAESAAENEQLKKRVEESERAVKVASTKLEIDRYLSESELPEIARNRIAKRFEGAQASEGIQEAIAEEKAYVEAIRLEEKANAEKTGKDVKPAESDKGKIKASVKNLGESATVPNGLKPNEAQAKRRADVFERLGMSPKAAALATMVN